MSAKQLSSLPAELLKLIIDYLPNSAIKALRLTSTSYHAVAELRLTRVFLSAHELDIQVFRSVADHSIFRHSIVEIVWDDAIFRGPGSSDEDAPDMSYEDRVDDHVPDISSSKRVKWFYEACQDNIRFHESRQSEHQMSTPSHPVSLMSLQDCWKHYHSIVIKQDRVLANGADADALVYGLERFPALRTITVTPAAHGYLHHPLYETPTIRAFPPGFNYPIPRGWPSMEDKSERGRNRAWFLTRPMWHGLLTVFSKLRENPHRITTLSIDPRHLSTGFHSGFFLHSRDVALTQERGHLMELLGQPGFRRLDLGITMFRPKFPDNWCALRRLSNIKQHLARIGPHLEHLNLTVDIELVVDRHLPPNGPMTYRVKFLDSLFPDHPAERWPRLRHFGLAGIFAVFEDLVALLRAMPPTLRTLELGRICFLRDDEHWRGFLTEMRDSLGWGRRQGQGRDRVRVRLVFPTYVNERLCRIIVVEDEVNAFLYDDGENPFDQHRPDRIRDGVGVIRDAFDAGFERPNAHNVN